jgi:amino acid adenylation domain-containing protein
MLSDSQRASLVARLREGRAEAPAGITRRRAVLDEIPLSFGQEQLWFIDQLAPGLPTYNIAGTLSFTGALDVGALSDAVGALMGRHEVLRTRLVNVDGRPRQVIDELVHGSELAVLDLSGMDPQAAEAELARVSAQESERPFVLARGPLLRTRLVRIAEDSHVLLVVVHHTVFDGWSFGVFTRELIALYEAAVTGAAPELAELPVQFADYALWERERLRGSVYDELASYWQQSLAGAASLQLPADRVRPLLQTYDGGLETISMEGALLDRLKALGRSHGATLFMTLLAAFQVLLHRFSGQDDIVVGTVSANRSRDELAPLIGYLVNTLAIRSDLSGDPTFPELLERVRTATLGAYAHQDLPFAKLVETLRVHRDPGRHPVFQVGFNLAESYDTAFSAAGLIVEQKALQSTAAKFDLLLSAAERKDGLQIVASYASALFDRATVRRLLGHFQVLLAGIVADPEQPLSRLPVMSAADRRWEIAECNATAVEYPLWCLHEKFEVQVKAMPDEVAVELDGARLTYSQLNAQANQVARRLRELGAGPEILIGVCMQRTSDRIAALLGILKAGSGYVPLDPEYPADRLAFMVEDAHMPVVITDDLSKASVPLAAAHVVSMDRDRAALSELESSNPSHPTEQSSVAYVIYTSGSTGRPKGVVVEHRQAVNFVTGEIEHWPLGPGDRVLQFASLNFDVSVLDMFGALLSGATLVLGKSETLLSPPRLAELIRNERITFMCLPPAVLNLLAHEQFPDLRVVIAGGEAFSSALVRSWARPGMRFINGYGPTETTVGATMLECRDDGIDPPPIGLPLPNYTAYVLDGQLSPVPIGVAGELHLGGAGVARGYLNRPELTAERFIPDPFGDASGARLYKTGDVARRMPDGNLQFLGRLDDQVKIRGLRVELGEIEAVLAQHAAVLQAAVVVGADRAGQQQLVAYARTDPARPTPTPADLRLHLAGRLPGFMVPPHVLTLDAFPLSANGKVDRSRLPAPDSAENAGAYLPPRTVIEAVLVDAFGTLLNLDRIGIDDSFFELGGNSLHAMQLIARLRKDLAVDTDVTTIFLAPTAAQLAAALQDKYGLRDCDLDEDDADQPAVADEGAARGAAPAGSLVRLSYGSGTLPLYLIHAIGGTVYAYAPLARELADTYEVWGIEAAGMRAGTTPLTSLAGMIDRYVTVIRAAQPSGPYRLAGWSFGGLVALRVAEQLNTLGERVAFVTLMDTPLHIHEEVTQTEAQLAAFYAADAARALGPDTGQPPDPASSTVADQLQWLADRLTTGAEAMGVSAEMERRFEVYKAHLKLIAGYVPPAVHVDILVVGAQDSTDNAAEWSRALPGNVRSIRVPGDHYSFLDSPGVLQIAAALRKLSAVAVERPLLLPGPAHAGST